jgi:hypothetical protein
MVRSSVAAFYALPECLFYSFAGPVRRDRFLIFRLLHRVRSEVEKVVHWIPEILFAAQIAFGGLHGGMPEQELNLLLLTAAIMAQLRAGPPQVVRCDMLHAHSLAAGSDHVPDNVLREAAAPHLSRPGDCSKDPTLLDFGCPRPLIEGRFDPFWNVSV